MTLIEMLGKNAEKFPQKTALIYEGRPYTYSRLYETVISLGGFLTDMNFSRGERAALFMDRKSPELVISFLAVAWCGGMAVPVDYNQPVENIKKLVSIIAPSMMVVTDTLVDKSEEAGMASGTDCKIVVGTTPASGYTPFDEAVETGAGKKETACPEMDRNDIVYLNLTSGTTGLPKCAETTHDNIYWNTVSAVKDLELTHEDVHLCMFPPSTHPHELFARSLYLGGTAVLTDHIAPKSLTQVIEENKVTAMMAIAPIYANLVKCHRGSGFSFSTLRLAESGGMHLDPVIAGSFKERFGQPIVPVWGSTETAGIALAMPLHREFRKGACGRTSSFYEAKIVDGNGVELEPGEVGEMIISGKGVCKGYYNNTAATRQQFRDGWYWTGDMFSRDEDGYFYFQGRENGMMKVGGMKVFPVEIEDCLVAHPAIKEVAVVKETSSMYGEIPKAVVVLEEGATLDKKTIRKYCETYLAKHKVPKKIEFMAALPRTPGGKILQKALCN